MRPPLPPHFHRTITHVARANVNTGRGQASTRKAMHHTVPNGSWGSALASISQNLLRSIRRQHSPLTLIGEPAARARVYHACGSIPTHDLTKTNTCTLRNLESSMRSHGLSCLHDSASHQSTLIACNLVACPRTFHSYTL